MPVPEQQLFRQPFRQQRMPAAKQKGKQKQRSKAEKQRSKEKKKMNKEINKTKIIINGKTILADKNQTILQACEKIGLYIPRFCYNEALSIAGNCRMCLVEIEKSPKLMPACAIKIANDMKIYTKTNLVKKTRESILEFLLINHPLDCPICDQGGECDLQDQALVYGSDRGRFYEYKRSVQDKNAGPLIKTIMTRCIHCTRCIRYATEIAGVEVYGTTGRGKSMEVGTYISSLFNSEISGNVIDLCPVGALTSKPYAFTVRPWELKNIETIDLFDALGSNIRVDIKGSELMRILPKANNKINQQWISDKSRFAHDGLKCQRLYYPLLKEENKSNKFLVVSWQKAIEIIIKQGNLEKKEIFKMNVNKIQENKNNKGGIIGHFIDQETIITFKKILNQLGINNIYIEQTLSLIHNKVKTNTDFRWNYLTNFNFDQIENENYDTILLIGTNPRYEASMLNVRLRQYIMKKKNKEINILYLGSPLNLTYKTKQIGNNLENLYLITQGKSKNTIKLLQGLKALSIMSYSITERPDNKALNYMLEKTFTKWYEINKNNLNKKYYNAYLNKNYRKLHNWSKKNIYLEIIKGNENIGFKEQQKETFNKKNYINILHTNAAIPGALDLGINTIKKTKINDLNFIYLLGADCNNEILKNKPFIIYQGHHGCNAAKIANVILPSTTFIEKKGTYINTQGFVQQTERVLNPDNNIQDDWKILQNIAFNVNIPGIKNARNIHKTKNKITENNKESFINTINSKVCVSKKVNKKKNKKLQNIINIWLLTQYDNIKKKTNMSKENKNNVNNVSKLINNEIVFKTDITHNFQKNFENITPNASGTTGTTCNFNNQIKPLKSNITKYHVVYKSPIIYDRDNFYLSDIITKTSITMGKCSINAESFKNPNF